MIEWCDGLIRERMREGKNEYRLRKETLERPTVQKETRKSEEGSYWRSEIV